MCYTDNVISIVKGVNLDKTREPWRLKFDGHFTSDKMKGTPANKNRGQ